MTSSLKDTNRVLTRSFRRSFLLSRPGGNQEVSFATTSDPSMFNGLSINSTTKKQLPNDRLKRR